MDFNIYKKKDAVKDEDSSIVEGISLAFEQIKSSEIKDIPMINLFDGILKIATKRDINLNLTYLRYDSHEKSLSRYYFYISRVSNLISLLVEDISYWDKEYVEDILIDLTVYSYELSHYLNINWDNINKGLVKLV